MKIKMDPTQILSIAVTVLGIAGTLLSNKVDANNRKAMKSELKDEIMKEILKNKES